MDNTSYYKHEKKEQERLRRKNLITSKRQRTANKIHFCEKCGCEIPKGDSVWWYKPYPVKNKITGKVTWSHWRTRCVSHEPMRYNPDNFNEEVSEHSYEDNGYGKY